MKTVRNPVEICQKTSRKKTTWENDIKMNFKEMEYEGMVWIHLAQEGVQWRALV